MSQVLFRGGPGLRLLPLLLLLLPQQLERSWHTTRGGITTAIMAMATGRVTARNLLLHQAAPPATTHPRIYHLLLSPSRTRARAVIRAPMGATTASAVKAAATRARDQLPLLAALVIRA
jgi:hypothetical protein